jgi:O-antigen/teichoic acid export membrane protein
MAKLVVLGRLLSPADFGLLGVALLVTSLVEYLTDLGFNAALVHKRGDIRPYLDTAWLFQIGRGAVLATLVVVAAPFAATLLSEPASVLVIRVLAAELLIRSFVNPGIVYLRRDLEARREVLWRSAGVTAGLLIGVMAAFVLRNVWALVVALLAASIMDTLLSYWVHPYRPRLRVDLARARELMQFGRWVSAMRVLTFIVANFPGFVVARVSGSFALGQFQMAQQLAVVGPLILGTHVYGVLFPALSDLRDDAQRRRAFLRALSMLAAVTVPLAAMFSVFGPWLIGVGLGAQWAGTEPILQILAWTGCARALTLPASALFQAMNRPRLAFQAGLPNSVILIVLAYSSGLHSGVLGVSIVACSAALATLPYQLMIVVREAGVSTRAIGRAVSGGVVAALPIILVGLLPESGIVATAVFGVLATIASGAMLLKTLHVSLTRSTPRLDGAER